jgi:outer membrane lipoprotein-sorting protein
MQRLLLSLSLLFAVTAGAQESVDAVLDRATTAYAHVTTTRATFEQLVTNEVTGTSAPSKGELVQQRPNKLSVRFTDPASDRIVADGSWLWVYVPSATPGQVIKMPSTGPGASAIDFVQQFLDAPREHFEVSAGTADSSLGHKAHTLKLIPKDQSSSIANATVWIDDDDGVIRQFQVTDGTGSTRRVRLTKVTFNVPVDHATFTFKVPDGVKVVDKQQMMSGS